MQQRKMYKYSTTDAHKKCKCQKQTKKKTSATETAAATGSHITTANP